MKLIGPVLLLALLAGCAAPVYEASQVENRIAAPVLTKVVSLDSPMGKARWVTFLMDELYELRRANDDGKHGDYEIALLLEIAAYDLYPLRIAAEAMYARMEYKWTDVSIWNYIEFCAFTNLICKVRIDHEPITGEDGKTFTGRPLMIEDGKLKIEKFSGSSGRRLSGPRFFDLTDYQDGRTMHEMDVEYNGLRDLAPYSSQRLTEGQLDELRAKYADWGGDVFVPDEPDEPHYVDQWDGLIWHLLGSVRSIENEHALSALCAAGIGTSVHVSGGTTHISVYPDDLEQARQVVRADAEKHGYAFRE